MPRTRYLLAILCLLAIRGTPALAAQGYVGCSTPDEAYSFDLDSYAVGPAIDLMPEGNYPYDATITPDGLEVWIPGACGDGVVVIDRASGTVLQRISTGEYPVSLAFSDDGSIALVSCRDSDRLDRINTSSYQVFGSLPIPSAYQGPGNISLDPSSGNFYLVNWYGDQFYEIASDGSAILRQVPLGDGLWQLVSDPAGQYLYVTDRGTDQLRVVDRETLLETTSVNVGDDPWGVDITLDGSQLVVCCEDDNTVHFIDTGDWSSTLLVLPADADPRDVDILDEDGLAFVAGGTVTGGNPVYLVDLAEGTLSGSIPIPGANTNVVAVQVQASSGGTGVGETPPASPVLTLHPNPFNPLTRISYSLTSAGPVELSVHGLDGSRLRLLASGWRSEGPHETVWDGCDRHGQQAASGVYLLRLTTDAGTRTEKAVLLK